MATSLRDFFGFILKDKDSKPLPKSIVSPNAGDGSVVIDSTVNGVVGDSYLLAFDPEGQIKNEIDLIRRYRELSKFPEVSEAIEDIINESIITDDSGKVVSLNLDELKLSEGLKKKIIDSFNEILVKLDFITNGHEIFKNWYIDGKLLYQIILDETDIKKGIHELRYIDPRKIKKIKNIKKETVSPGIEIIKDIDEYYLYNDKGISNTQQAGVKLSKDSVVYCHSGIIDPNSGMVQSYLHKAIRPANQLKMLEESVVIYRYTRAPERRVFYIDVGNLPKGKAEQYVNDMMNKFKNKLSYDAVTGDLVDSKRHLCLDMNTKVPLLDGRTLTISEISAEMQSVGTQLWAYSCDPITGKFAPGKITWAGVSRPNAQVMRITLDNGETITCTPDHKFPVWNKGFVKAEDLCAGESMIPHYTRQHPIAKGAEKNYEQIFENETGKWQYTHRAVSNWKDAVGAHNKSHPNYAEWHAKAGKAAGVVNSISGVSSENRTKTSNLSGRGNAAKKKWFADPNSEVSIKHRLRYATEYPADAFSIIQSLVKEGKTKQEVIDYLNDSNIREEFMRINSMKVMRNQKDYTKFNTSDVSRIIAANGYSGFKHLRESLTFKNHKIAKIEWLNERMDTGCLTIDGNEEFHNFHTFALSAGIYTQNQMMEDFWLPRRDNGKSTEITTLPGGSGMSQLDDLDYFLNKLYHSLNVPVSRMKPETGFSIGRSDTISRDEIKFGKFVEKLRTKFNSLFMDLLRVQLVSKGICTVADWDGLKDKIKIIYAEDNHFSELKENEILNTRLSSLSQIDAYVGKYVSKEWVQRHILKFTEEEISELNKQLKEENKENTSPEELAAQQTGDQAGPPQ